MSFSCTTLSEAKTHSFTGIQQHLYLPDTTGYYATTQKIGSENKGGTQVATFLGSNSEVRSTRITKRYTAMLAFNISSVFTIGLAHT